MKIKILVIFDNSDKDVSDDNFVLRNFSLAHIGFRSYNLTGLCETYQHQTRVENLRKLNFLLMMTLCPLDYIYIYSLQQKHDFFSEFSLQ